MHQIILVYLLKFQSNKVKGDKIKIHSIYQVK